MSRELWLLRHGKAERFDSSEDYDRTLKKRGKRDAKSMGEWMKEAQSLPDLIVSSPAIRAITTAKIVCDVFSIDHRHIRQEKRLYDEGLVRVKSVLADCPANFSRVLLVGHNPELEDLISHLVNETDLPDHKKLFPTAALARLMLPDDWSHLNKGCAQLLSITYSKSLLEENLEES